MRYWHNGLVAMVAFCVAVRVAAWLIAPAWPLILTLGILLGLYRLIFDRPYRRR
ncbi:MAG: hypothetical protein QOH36_1273 [Actinomycetota bacterium]|nr:hypothetical protein [Actinomycetota bacterium]